MKKRVLITAAAAVILVVAAVIPLGLKNCAAAKPAQRVDFQSMGTVCSFTVYGSEKLLDSSFDAGKAEFDRVVAGCSLYDPASELSRLNETAGEMEFICSEAMWFLIKRAQQAYIDSDGEFDITVKPLMMLWGFYRKQGNKAPGEAEIAETKKRVGFDKLILDDSKRSVRFAVPGMALDLGGIAKGYAADLAVTAMVKCGAQAGVVDVGGNLRFLPKAPPGRNSYAVGIRDPRDRRRTLPEKLELAPGRAVATSGDYERGIILDGVRYGHIISPKTGKLRKFSPISVTVVADTAIDADVFSTSCYLGGRKLAEKLKQRYPGIKIIFSE